MPKKYQLAPFPLPFSPRVLRDEVNDVDEALEDLPVVVLVVRLLGEDGEERVEHVGQALDELLARHLLVEDVECLVEAVRLVAPLEQAQQALVLGQLRRAQRRVDQEAGETEKKKDWESILDLASQFKLNEKHVTVL